VSADPVVLQIEDDEGSHFVFRQLFEELCPELKLHRAKDGIEAMAMIKSLAGDSSAQLALVVLDVFLPIENGWNVLEQIRAEELSRQTPVVMFTGQTIQRDQSRAHQLGVQYIQKPGDLASLILIVKEICAKGRGRAQTT
jgi:CheY-like chemotaxis protein